MSNVMHLWRSLGGVLLTATLCAGCLGGTSDQPVASVSVTFNADSASVGGPLEVTYRFELAPGQSLDQNYWVMAHFATPDGDVVWNDDHRPPTPTTQWSPGQAVAYTRSVFVPNALQPGNVSLLTGLYSPDSQQRLPLAGQEVERHAYRVAVLRITPPDVLTYGDGWNEFEGKLEDPERWRWTKQRATVSLRNPKTAATLWLNLQAADQFSITPHSTVFVNGRQIGAFDVPAKERLLQRLEVASDLLGTGDTVEVTIAVDKTFSPAQISGGQFKDVRNLGVRVFNIALVPKS